MPKLPSPSIVSKVDPRSASSPSSPLSGFGSVMEQERDLQTSTAGYLGADNGAHSIALDRILRNQGVRLGTNIALLEQRYEMLPHPSRFQALQGRLRPLTKARRVKDENEGVEMLPHLVAQHLDVLEKIAALIAHRSGSQRGEMILAEMARNHEEMAWMLTALLKEGESVRDLVPIPVIAAAAPLAQRSTEAWENEGGAPPARAKQESQ